MLFSPLLCRIQRRVETGGHGQTAAMGLAEAPGWVSRAPSCFPFLLREGTAGKAKPQAKVTTLGGGSESREVQGHTKANTASSNPNVSLPGKESLLAANRNVPKVILMKAFCSAMARTKTTLSLFNYFRHTQEHMPKTCTNLRIKAT